MKTSVTYGVIWRIAYPIIIGSVAQNLLNVIDTAFLGRVGEVALGAGAIGGIFYLVFTMLAWGFGIGTQIIIARRNGEHAYHEIGRTFQHGFYFMVPLALGLFSIMQFFSGDILKFIIKSPGIFEGFRDFMAYRSYGIFFAGINMLFSGFYIGISKTKVITWATSIAVFVNIILDYGFIFGHFGLPEMGIGGAALASSISEFASTALFVLYTLYRLDGKKYNLFKIARFDDALYKRIIRIATPVMLQNFFSMAAWLTFFLFIEKLGEQALAVSNIIRSFYIILVIPVWGFSSAANSLVSNLIGQGREDEVMPLVYKVVKLCTLGVLFTVFLGCMFPGQALRIYTDDSLLIQASIPALYVIYFAAFFLAIAFMFFSAVSGTGKTQVSFAIEILVLTFYLVLSYILSDVLKMKVQVVWLSECFYSIMIGLISYWYLIKGRWKTSTV